MTQALFNAGGVVKINNRKEWSIKVNKRKLKYIFEHFPMLSHTDIAKIFKITPSASYYHYARWKKGNYVGLPSLNEDEREELLDIIYEYMALHMPEAIPGDVVIKSLSDIGQSKQDKPLSQIEKFNLRVLKGIKLRKEMEEKKEMHAESKRNTDEDIPHPLVQEAKNVEVDPMKQSTTVDVDMVSREAEKEANPATYNNIVEPNTPVVSLSVENIPINTIQDYFAVVLKSLETGRYNIEIRIERAD